MQSGTVRFPFFSRSVAVLLLATVFPALVHAAATTPIGATAGSFSVDANGGANYSIPIAVPPGTAGMVPRLSLNYSRTLSSGYLANGWSIGGLSVIQRCGRTVSLDGQKGGVSYDDNDRFCLDGQRLVAINGGVYGANDTEYRTERETFSKIISYRDVDFTGKGPQRFIVNTASGSTMEYGVNTDTDSRIEAQGRTDGTVRLWALNKVQDLSGNYFTISYFEDTANGGYRPTRIDYTGNSSASLSPYNSVQFVYETADRTDNLTRYEAGSSISSPRRLTNIKTYTGNVLVRDYRLSHDYSADTGASRLVSAQECGADNVCLPATTFGWSVAATSFATDSFYGARAANYSSNATGFQLVDVNGDGLPDMVYNSDGDGGEDKNIRVLLNTGNGFGEDRVWGTRLFNYNGEARYFRLVDVNGDGLPDVVYNSRNDNGSDHRIRVLLNTGSSFGVDTEWGKREYNFKDRAPGFHLADVNGDGLPDVVYSSSDADGGKGNSMRVLLNTGSGFGLDYVWGVRAANYQDTASGFQLVDVNSDGLPDIVYNSTGDGGSGQYMRVLLNTGSAFGVDTVWGTRAYGYHDRSPGFHLSDLNNDGLPDLVYGSNAGNNAPAVRVLLNNGTAFEADTGWGNKVANYHDQATGLQLVDMNGDGLPDLVYNSAGDGGDGKYIRVMLGTGSNFGTDTVWGSRMHGFKDRAKGIQFADMNGDGLPDMFYSADGDGGSGSNMRVLFDTNSDTYSKLANQLTSVVNGVGVTHRATFKQTVDRSVYSPDPGLDWNPYKKSLAGLSVVSGYTVSDGQGGDAGVSYHYAGAKAHIHAGWLGFREITVTDERTGNRSVRVQDQNVEQGLYGTTLSTENYIGSTLTSRTQNFYSLKTYLSGSYAGPQKHIRLNGTLAETFDLTGDALSCTQVDSTYDDFGFTLSVVSKSAATCSFTNAVAKNVSNTYDHDTSNWRLGRIVRSQLVNSTSNVPSITRSVAYTYNGGGLLVSDTVEPDSSSLWVKTSYTYDIFGNRTRVEVSGPDFTARSTIATYDAQGCFALSNTNALGHSESRTFDPKWGAILSQTGPNGLTTTMDYDGLGRLVSTTSPDNKTVTNTIALCDGSDPDCPLYARVRATTTATSNGVTLPPSTTYKDLLGRTLRTKGQAPNGQDVFQDTEYNNLGQVYRSSFSYYRDNNPSQWTTYAYDLSGRTVSVTASDNSVTTTTYTVTPGVGLKTCVTNAKAQTSCVQMNAVGQAYETTDAMDGKTALTFDAVGNIIKVVDAKNNTVLTAVYDNKGRKTSMVDADAGSRSYAYNALGELLNETDAKGQVASVTYDLLGRIKTRTNLEGTYAWTYDITALGATGRQALGRLTSIVGTNYSATPAYDNFGRELSVTTGINGTAYTTSTQYDAHGRPDTVTYPTGFKTKNVYDNGNRVAEVRNSTTNALYWQVSPTSYNEFGQLTSFTLGNGLTTNLTYNDVTHALATVRTGSNGAVQSLDYSFDVLGNLISRRDNNQGYTETFDYDALNRLTSMSGPTSKIYTYDEIGNITAKSDVGNYTYHQTKIHAVVSTSGVLNNTYTYDANGNMITGANRTIGYTSFNKPAQITANGITTGFTYGPGFERLTKTNTQSSTVYLGKLYESFTQGANVTHRHYVVSPGGLVAVVSIGATNNVRYLHGDHLGSTNVITDETGTVVERLSFDPHGLRRQPNGQPATQPITSSVNRGYTGHEMDDESGLINMNAREYDPVLGRLVQADTIIDGGVSQGFNRYSYVGNNPLSATDPSGNSSVRKQWQANLGTWKKVIGKYWFTDPYNWNPLAPVNPAYAQQLAHGHYVSVVKLNQDSILVDHPEYQPYVKAIGNGIASAFNWGWIGPPIDGIFDFRMCTGAGGNDHDCRTGAYQSVVKGYLMYGVSLGIDAGFSSEGVSFSKPNSFGNVMVNVQWSLAKTAISEISTHNGVSPIVVNAVLFATSWVGSEAMGDRWNGRYQGGFFTRGPFIGSSLLFDIADVILEYQGYPSGSYLSVVDRIKSGEISEEILSSGLIGHSLGAITVRNLVANGVIQSGIVFSLPALSIGGTNLTVNLGAADIINFGFIGTAVNPGANVVWSWKTFSHICGIAYTCNY